MSTFVLVHGGWHGGWCWRKLTPLLRDAGHEVYTPTLTGLGERAHLVTPTVDLAGHVQDLRAVLEAEDLRDVVLVGHSYAGAVITGLAADPEMARRVARLVFLDGFVPAAGQSVLELLPVQRRQAFLDLARDRGDGWLVPLDWDSALAGWGVTDPADLAWMGPRMTPQPLATLCQPLPAAPVLGVPRSYLHCRYGPSAPIFRRFADLARADPEAWTVVELDTGHDAMVTRPAELFDAIFRSFRSAAPHYAGRSVR
jgi:pimeloyl-ACP methyl ester carboxylesterase